MSEDVQLDLFGVVAARLDARADWEARFERADWVAPWDTAAGFRPGDPPLKKGERAPVPGWRCPDPECGQVEPTAYLLGLEHGWDPEVPGHEPFDGRCHRLRRLAAQAGNPWPGREAAGDDAASS